jgi:hypothetical protein
MAQLGETGRRAIHAEKCRTGAARAGVKQLIAVVLGVVILATATGARADGGETPEEQASCVKRLEPAEKAIEHDYKYARAWTDSWIVGSTTMVVLSLTQAFMVDDYKRAESLTFAFTSLLLQIQRPLALTSGESLKQIRASALQDPCLALADASHVLKSNQVDGELHRGWPIHVINVAFNLAVAAVLGLWTQHFDYVGDSNLGLLTTVGIGLAELNTFTYPSGSIKATEIGRAHV